MKTRQQRRAAARATSGPPGPQRGIGGSLMVLGVAAVVAGALWFWPFGENAPVRDGAPSWTPDSRQVLFYSEQGGKGDIVVADRDGSNRHAIRTTPVDEGGPAMSPNGDWIAFDTDRDGNFEIYVMRADGSVPRRLTTDPARDVAPSWSPDGRYIVFMSARDNREFDLYRMAPDGTGVERLTQGSSNWFPQYAPDGRRIALHVMRDVHILDVESKALSRLTQDPLNGMHPTWSPDGKQLAFMSWRNGRTEIFTANDDGSNQELLISMPTGDAVDPRWSPDGTRIAFVHVPSGGLNNTQTESDERIVYVYEIATKTMKRVSR